MKNPIPFFLFTLLALFITVTHANSHITTNDLVLTTCKQTPDPALCKTALRSDPRSSKATNTQALTLIMIDVINTRFTDSLRYIENISRSSHDPDITLALEECIRVLRVVVDTDIDLTKRAVQQGDPKFGEDAMVDAGNEAEACRKEFSTNKDPGQITVRTRMLRGVSNVAASMIKTME